MLVGWRGALGVVLCLASTALAGTPVLAWSPVGADAGAMPQETVDLAAGAVGREGPPHPTSPDDIPSPRPLAFRCTEVIGYSQVAQWFRQDKAFEYAAGPGRWQLLWQLGGGVDRWRDPEYAGWHGPVVSPCAESSDTPDRVLLSISGPYGDDVDTWAAAIRETVANIRRRYAGVRQIVLQPVVGGPDRGLCVTRGNRVRASWQQPYIDEAIARVVGGEVVRGLSPVVRSCGDYRDDTGHLTDAGAAAAGRAIGAYYRDGPR